MDMTMEPGGFSGDRVLLYVNQNNLPVYQSQVVAFLRAQPDSYSRFLSIEAVLEFIGKGLWQGWILVDDEGYARGLMLTSVNDLGEGVRSLNIEFLSCRQFFWMAQTYPSVERIARVMRCECISAIAHPVIAEYAVKKHDYQAPGVFITKTLTDHGRKN